MTDQTLPTDAQIKAALAAVAGRPSVTDVYYVACGGSYSIMLPNQYAMDRHATSLAGHALNAAEFLARNPARLGASSVVILCSHSGTTPETVEAAKFARAKGARTIALTNLAGSPLDEAAEFTVLYRHAPKTFAPDHSPAVLARLTFGILATREGSGLATKIDTALAQLPALVAKANDLLGKNLSDVLPPDQAQQYLRLIHETLRTGHTQTLEYEIRTLEGLRQFEGRTQPLGVPVQGDKAVVLLARDLDLGGNILHQRHDRGHLASLVRQRGVEPFAVHLGAILAHETGLRAVLGLLARLQALKGQWKAVIGRRQCQHFSQQPAFQPGHMQPSHQLHRPL